MTREGSALFFEQGTGKTWIIMGVIERLIETLNRHVKVLLIVPLSNFDSTWGKLLDEHFGENEHRLSYVLYNYEQVPKNIKWLRKAKWDLVVYDESQRLKDRGGLASRTAKKLAGSATKRIILSGTPIEQAPQNLWAQLRFAAPECFGTRWKDFEDQYLSRTGYMGYKRKFRPERLEAFLARLKPYAIRLKKEDVLKLPPMKVKRVPVVLLGRQRQVYDQLETDMVTTIEGRDITADLAITLTVKLQQVCNGFLYTDDGSLVAVGRAKLRRVITLIHRADKPVVVFFKYREDLRQLQNALGNYRLGVISGRTRKTNSATIEAFQRADIDVLLCQIKSGGVGIDLYRAHHAIFYSMTFSSIDYEQALARLHRIGQNQPVTIWVLYAQNTVDAEIISSILEKRSVSEAILTRLVQRRRFHGKEGKERFQGGRQGSGQEDR